MNDYVGSIFSPSVFNEMLARKGIVINGCLNRVSSPLVMRRIPWPAVSTEWTSEELLDRLNNALSHCTSNDVVITGTGQHDRSLPFTLFSALKCDACAAICDTSEEFLTHTLKCRFTGVHEMFYKRLGMVRKDVQKVLEDALLRRSSMVGRAFQNNQELCVLTPIESPLAPFIFSGVTVSTSRPKCEGMYAEMAIEGSCVKGVPIYFSVPPLLRRARQMTRYKEEKSARRRFRELKRRLKPFTIEVRDLLEEPPEDVEDARFFFEAIDLPELTKIIPAKKLRLRVPIFSASDLIKPETPPTSPVNTPSKRFVSDRFTVTDKVESRTKAPAAVNLSTSPLFVSTSKIEFISPGNVLSKCDKALLQSLYSVYFKNRLIL